VQVVNAAGGSFTLKIGTETTTPIAWDAATTDVKSAIETFGPVNSVDVALDVRGSIRLYTITFTDPAHTNISSMTATSSLVTSQDHANSPTTLVHTNGTPVNASQRDKVNAGAYAPPAPDWSAIQNGDFQTPGGAGTDYNPGWSDHGGGGSGDITQSGAASFLVLSDGNASRTHNDVYVAPNATQLAFDIQRMSASSDDVLRVMLGTVELGTIALDASDTGWVSKQLAIDPTLRDDVGAISFDIVSTSGTVESVVQVDNVHFASSRNGVGRAGDVITVDRGGDDLTLETKQSESGPEPEPEKVPAETSA